MSHSHTAKYLGFLALASSSCAEPETVDTGPLDVVIQTETWQGLGQWLLTAVVTSSTGEESCDENFTSYRCRGGGSSDSDLETTQTSTRTPGGQVHALFEDESGKVWLANRSGRVYPGTREGQVFTFEWAATADSTSSVASTSNLPVGQRYNYDETTTGTSSTTISLTVDLAEGKATGTSDFQLESEFTFTESDEWSYYDNNGRSSGLSYGYLVPEGGYYYYYYRSNRAYDDDCSGNTCQLTIERTQNITHDLTGELVTTDVDLLLDLLDFSTPSGLGGAPF